MALLEVKDLGLNFAGLQVIKELSFSVEPGSIASLIGPNGAGKTSVFNCLTGFYKPNSGQIIFDGKQITRKRPYKITRSGMARTFQNLRLFKKMTVLENVMSGMHCRNRAGAIGAILRTGSQKREEAEIKDFCEFCLEFVGILDEKDRTASNLSYGHQRRVEWARALATGDWAPTPRRGCTTARRRPPASSPASPASTAGEAMSLAEAVGVPPPAVSMTQQHGPAHHRRVVVDDRPTPRAPAVRRVARLRR